MRGTRVDFEDCLMLFRAHREKIDLVELTEYFNELLLYEVAETRLKPNMSYLLISSRRMDFMADKKLYKNLSKLGFPMFGPSEDPDTNETLAEVVKSDDTRLWEGFPVLLANAAENYQFSLEQVLKQLDTEEQKQLLHQLVLLSASVYSMYHLSFSWFNKLKKDFSDKDKKRIKIWRNNLVHRQPLQEGDNQFDSERVTGFLNSILSKKLKKIECEKRNFMNFQWNMPCLRFFLPNKKNCLKKSWKGTL
jgi:hypothetical protein